MTIIQKIEFLQIYTGWNVTFYSLRISSWYCRIQDINGNHLGVSISAYRSIEESLDDALESIIKNNCAITGDEFNDVKKKCALLKVIDE